MTLNMLNTMLELQIITKTALWNFQSKQFQKPNLLTACVRGLPFGECPLYFSALQNSQNVFKVFILTVTIRSPQVQLSDTRTVTKTARKSTRSYSFIAHSLATQEFPVIADFIYWLSLHSCQNAHVLFVTQYDNNTFATAWVYTCISVTVEESTTR